MLQKPASQPLLNQKDNKRKKRGVIHLDMNAPVCQCCGMPLTGEDLFSREKDGSLNKEYCKWCYADGQFAYADKSSLLDFLLAHMPNPDGTPDAERRAAYDGFLSGLKHWKE